jgi:hypothetical protein
MFSVGGRAHLACVSELVFSQSGGFEVRLVAPLDVACITPFCPGWRPPGYRR